ncbi:hypothetical protein [Paraburkholderia phenoliruptrix]|uniref:hypothetical protein n=1 Tax=Paraburkholderia phenoliruptrix TaxID=252970 RepID=UPI001C6DF669|nr:hypothetical protein [Paraburkholderia phenoliruptrix]MBW9105106.1 hypothetical protein [Paraburkholderia phenoliruptrix]MBW9129752.1 hypothetical protein [Paraburkholderia ginsengiterrae]
MFDEPSPRGLFTSLNEQEYRRLRTLNEQLGRAELWISRRGHEMATAYCLAAAQARHLEKLDEDVELIATILFLRANGTAVSRDHIVSRIDIPLFPRVAGESADSNTRPTEHSENDPEAWSPLFLDLYERALQRDATKLLSIGALCVDIALIQQQLRSW